MKTNRLAKIVMAAIIMTPILVAAFVLYTDTGAVGHPRGPMIGEDEQGHPYGVGIPMMEDVNWDEMIYVNMYSDEECTADDRIIIGTPIRVIDANGTLYWYCLCENRTLARDRG